jgi:hypothetical protein
VNWGSGLYLDSSSVAEGAGSIMAMLVTLDLMVAESPIGLEDCNVERACRGIREVSMSCRDHDEDLLPLRRKTMDCS